MKISIRIFLIVQIAILSLFCIRSSNGAVAQKRKRLAENKIPLEGKSDAKTQANTTDPPVIFDKDTWMFPGRESIVQKGFKKTHNIANKFSKARSTGAPVLSWPLSNKLSKAKNAYQDSQVRTKRRDEAPEMDSKGFVAPRQKGATIPVNPLGTHVKIPANKSLSNFDTVILNLVGDDDTPTTTEVVYTTEETTTVEATTDLTTAIITTEETTAIVETTTEEVTTVVPTESPTEIPTESPTELSTGSPTKVPSESSKDASTTEGAAETITKYAGSPTEGPTTKPGEVPTVGLPTEGPTVLPTQAPGGGNLGDCNAGGGGGGGSDGSGDIGGRKSTAQPTQRSTMHPLPPSCKNIKMVGGAPQVTAKVGSYTGTVVSTSIGDVLAFYGIPYAAAPVKELRFKRPQPPDSFFNPELQLDATKMKPPCYSSRVERSSCSVSTSGTRSFGKSMGSAMNASPYGSEDCLYLNLWIPKIVLQQKNYATKHYPVIVWIHGDGFLSGIGDKDEQEYRAIAHFAAGTSTIVANIQYRTGVFGFLYLGIPEAPGNMGLLDQTQALQWIEENIDCFGGDPTTITIMGHDMGAVFVGYHLISKISPSYFARAVMLGGSPNQPHVFDSSQDAYRAGMDFATTLGCVNTASIKSIHECLIGQNAESLWDLQMDFRSSTNPEHAPLTFPFVPTDNGHFLETNPGRMLENNVKNSNYNNGNGIIKGKVCPVLIGGVQNEGSTVLLNAVEEIEAHQATEISYDKFIRILQNLFEENSPIEIDTILHSYKNWEFLEDGWENQLNLAYAIGDYYFTCPQRRFSDLWSARGLNVYYYVFAHRPTSFNRTEWMGVVHGDEVDFFFGVPLLYPKKFTSSELILSDKMVKMLTQFVKTGEPTDVWIRYGLEKPSYLLLNTNASNAGYPGWNEFGPRPRHCDFWNEVFPRLQAISPKSVINSKGDCGSNDFELSSRASGIGGRHGDATHAIDDYCMMTLHNCSSSNFAIYVNAVRT